jgi:hypothetical protein
MTNIRATVPSVEARPHYNNAVSVLFQLSIEMPGSTMVRTNAASPWFAAIDQAS